MEVIFCDTKKKKKAKPPATLDNINRGNCLKILGVTFTSNLSASEHIRGVICDCAQTLYALRILRNHGLSEACLHGVFQAVVVAKLMYASPAWIGFTTATDHKRVDAFLRRAKRTGFCSPDLPPYDELLENADDKLFTNICRNPAHVLRSLLPTTSVASQHYGLRQRKHSMQLPTRTGHLTDSNFVIRLIYKDMY